MAVESKAKADGNGGGWSWKNQRHPALIAHETERLTSVQNRIADSITSFAGSMVFVYIHIAWFVVWFLISSKTNWINLLTMIVSLEAIFLATFVMISQNRAASRDEALASHHYDESRQMEQLLSANTQLTEEVKAGSEKLEQLLSANTDLTKQVHELTLQIHRHVSPEAK